MIESDDAVHELLHEWVSDVYAPADLADRAEAAARRRRAVRRRVTSALAVIALGATVGTLAAVRSGGGVEHPAAKAVWQRPLSCAANVNAYTANRSPAPHTAAADTAPLMPGDPKAAVLCRYTGLGEAQPVGALAGKAVVTDPAQLARLQRVINSGGALQQPGVVNCPIDNDQIAVVLILYPAAPTMRTVLYERYCWLLIGDSTVRWAGGGFDQLVTAWTGDWQPTAAGPAR